MATSCLTYDDLPGAGHTRVISGHAPGGRPIAYEVLGHEIEIFVLGDCQVYFKIFTSLRPVSPKRGIVATHLLQTAATDEWRAGVAYEIRRDEAGEDISSCLDLSPVVCANDV